MMATEKGVLIKAYEALVLAQGLMNPLGTERQTVIDAANDIKDFVNDIDMRLLRKAVDQCSPSNMKYFAPSMIMEDVDGELFNRLSNSTKLLLKAVSRGQS